MVHLALFFGDDERGYKNLKHGCDSYVMINVQAQVVRQPTYLTDIGAIVTWKVEPIIVLEAWHHRELKNYGRNGRYRQLDNEGWENLHFAVQRTSFVAYRGPLVLKCGGVPIEDGYDPRIHDKIGPDQVRPDRSQF